MRIVERLQKQLDAGNYTAGAFVDLKKAFDTVDHNILLEKLDYYGIRGVAKDLFCSYLDNRKQYVTLNGSNSSIKTILTGVPQGSVLGPLLFFIYINDLCKCVKYSETYHFADDTNMLLSHSSLETLAKRINSDLKNLSQWLKANKLSLNVTKTELIIFHSSSKKTDPSLKIILDRKRLIQTETVKYFGVLLDDRLLWSKQINHVSTKLNQAIGILSKLRNRASLKILKMTYHSLFCSHLIYGSQLWGQSNVTSQNKIHKRQSRALRKILFKKKQDSISQAYKELKILKFADLLYLQNCLFMSQIETNQRLANSFADLRHCGDNHTYLTKSKVKGLLDIPLVNTQIYGIQSIKYNCIKDWNNFINNFSHIPLHKCTYTLVKRQVKDYLIGKY